MAYSPDFRRKVLEVRKREGLTIQQVSARFSVGVASVTRWISNCHRKTYTRTKFRKLDPAVVAQDVRDYPDAYQYERANRLGVHQSAISYILKKLGVTYKKTTNPSTSRRRQTAYLPDKNKKL